MSIISHKEATARVVVSTILDDLMWRSGFDGVWDGIDDDTKDGIVMEWRKLTVAVLEKMA